jgi:putative redox protein
MSEKQFTEVTWRERMTFDAVTTTGHHLVLDAQPPGGDDRGPKPIELLLTALAGCTAMDVLSILQKMREPIKGLDVSVEGTRAREHPMVYTDIEIFYHIRGKVNAQSVVRAIELSQTQYCGVGAMLEPTARFRSHFEIETEDERIPELMEFSANRGFASH